jgi:endonuclease/exonuclease/phosphatase (EEP) superfamily protein YafD
VISVFGRCRRVAAWVAVVLLGAVCVLHLLGLTRWYWEIAVLTVTPWVLWPAWAIAIAAGFRRHWIMLGATAAIVGCQIAWVGPQFKPWDSASAPATAQRLRLFDANVSQSNQNPTAIGAEIKAARPQIVTLEELTPPALASLLVSGDMMAFRFSSLRARDGAGGMGLWSTLPLSDITPWVNQGGQQEIEATVLFAGRQVRIAVAHVYAPVGPDQPARWHVQLARLATHLAAQPRPLVVAGDFNATADLPQFRRILTNGLADAAVLAGEGWNMTWPRNQAWVLPYLRIDHVLLSPQLTETGYRLGTGRGSDHRPIIVDIARAA